MSSERSQQDLTVSGLRVAVALANELARCSDIDSVFRHAVEFAKRNLGLERCSIYVEDNSVLRGTFGTNLRGEITDEHNLQFPINELWRERIEALEATGIPWTTVEEIRREWDGEQARAIGVGWVALTPIRLTQKLIGVFFNDAAISGGPFDPTTQEVVSVFCSLLGSIVERKRAENALAEEHNLLRILIDTVPDHIFAKDTKGRFIVSNKAYALAASFLDPDAFIGKTASDFFPPDLAAQYDEDDRVVLQTGQPLVNAERVSLDAARNPINVATTKVPLRDAQGNLVGIVGISRDITAYKRAQEALKQQQEFLRHVIDAFPNSIFVKDWDGRYVLANQAIAEINGTTVEAMIGKRDSDLATAQEGVERFVRDDREVMITLKPKYIPEETLTNLTTGQSRLLQTIKVPLLSSTGIARHVLGVCVDITERKQAEEALHESEERYRTLTELISDYAFSMRVEPDATLLDEWITADSFTRLTGYTSEEIGGTLTLYHPDDTEAVRQQLREVLKGHSGSHECRIITKDGTERWLHLRRQPVWDAQQNRVVRYYGVAQDITERKRAEEALTLFRSLIDHSNDAIEVVDPETGRFLDVNETACLSHGYTREEYVALTVSEIDPLVAERWEELREDLRRSGSRIWEGLHRRKDGSVFPVEVNVNYVRLDRDYVLTVVRDITERKRAEEAHRESERLRLALEKEKELGDLKTRLMITISHEFRTPLSVAYASAELLENYYERMSGNQREEHFHRIETQVGKLTDMLEEISLLIHAKFERLSLNLEPVNLRDLCEAIILQMHDVDEAQERIVLKVDELLPDFMLDVRRVKYALTNLFSNALKYSDQATKVSLDVFRQNAGVMIQITDKGIGIPLEDQTHIFEPFYRGRNVGTVGGTGLGLSIVKEMIEIHKGTIRLKSELNQGTQVAIFLPGE